MAYRINQTCENSFAYLKKNVVWMSTHFMYKTCKRNLSFQRSHKILR